MTLTIAQLASQLMDHDPEDWASELADSLGMYSYWIKTALTYESSDGAIAEQIPAEGIIARRILVVTTVWDTAATLKVGTASDDDKYMTAAEIDLTTTGTYTVNDADYESAATDVELTWDHNSATQGAAVLLLEVFK